MPKGTSDRNVWRLQMCAHVCEGQIFLRTTTFFSTPFFPPLILPFHFFFSFQTSSLYIFSIFAQFSFLCFFSFYNFSPLSVFFSRFSFLLSIVFSDIIPSLFSSPICPHLTFSSIFFLFSFFFSTFYRLFRHHSFRFL